MSNRVYARVPVQQETLTRSSPGSYLLRRTSACDGGNFSTQESVPSPGSAMNSVPHFGHNFSRIPIYSPATGAIQTKQPGHGHKQLQMKSVQASRSGQIAVPAIVNEVLHSPGQPLDSATRAFMEPRFGHDFSRVRVHADIKAVESAAAVEARAYTVGQHVVFGKGQLSPETTVGRQLLAHELAHVVQQRRGGLPPAVEASSPLEQAADRAAAGILQGNDTIQVAGASAPGIARDTPRTKPPVPRVGHTPFHFISESPALDNWKLAVKEMLEREYKQAFASFEDATEHFLRHMDGLPSVQAREDYADRMRDRARKAFFRQEARNPSYAYTDDQLTRLRNGAAPIEGQQLEHLEEVKTKVREGMTVAGHPERALDPGNIYLTQGGKGGTAPKGTPHAEKWRTIKAAKDKSQEIRKNAQKPPEIEQPTRPLAQDMSNESKKSQQQAVTSSSPATTSGGETTTPERQPATTTETPKTGPTAHVGMPDMELIHEGGPSERGEALGGAVILGAQLKDWIMGKLGDMAQAEHAQTALGKKYEYIQTVQHDHPELGVLITRYWRIYRGNEGETSRRFEDISIKTGTTEREARESPESSLLNLSASPADMETDERWIPPLQPLSVAEYHTPYPKIAIATFGPGRAVLRDVKWGGPLGGFEKKGTTTLDVAEGTHPTFAILRPPASIRVEGYNPVSIDTGSETTFDGYKVPVISDLHAALVFPLDGGTAMLLSNGPGIHDTTYQLGGEFDLLRWVPIEDVQIESVLSSEVEQPELTADQEFFQSYVRFATMHPQQTDPFVTGNRMLQQPEANRDVLHFSSSGEVVTLDRLLAWAKQNYPRGLDDPTMLKNLYSSHEFSGSDDARERAAIALTLKLREEQSKGHTIK